MTNDTATHKPNPFSDEAIAAAMNKVMELGHLESAQATLSAVGHPPPMSDYLSLPPEIVDNPQRSAIHDKKSIFQRV